MSDYSDFEDDGIDSPQSTTPGMGSDDPKRHARAQHNALERRRRDNIKDMYSALRETVPEMNNERASRAVILKKTIDAIDSRAAKNTNLIEEKTRLQEENRRLQEEIEVLERELQDGNGTPFDHRHTPQPTFNEGIMEYKMENKH